MRELFPPGDMNNKTQSLWREFEFMLHQLQQAVEPTIGLAQTIAHWDEVCLSLSEAWRKRRPQSETKSLSS
jgi:hypothetical protein